MNGKEKMWDSVGHRQSEKKNLFEERTRCKKL